MKAYQVTLLIVDHDECGALEIAEILENARYPNRCISPQHIKTVEVDIGEWTDEHPLNQMNTWQQAYYKYFGES